MATKFTPERTSIDNQILVHARDIQSAQQAHQLACLELAQENTPQRQQAVAELEAEIKMHELAIKRLNAAKFAQAAANGAVDEAAKAARVAEYEKQHAEYIKNAMQHGVQLVDYIATIGPLWTQAIDSLSKARAVSREAVRLAGGKDGLKRFDNTTDNDGLGILANAVGSALAATGLGSTGPNLPFISVSPPTRPFTATDLERNLTNVFARQAEAIERATHPAQGAV